MKRRSEKYAGANAHARKTPYRLLMLTCLHCPSQLCNERQVKRKQVGKKCESRAYCIVFIPVTPAALLGCLKVEDSLSFATLTCLELVPEAAPFFSFFFANFFFFFSFFSLCLLLLRLSLLSSSESVESLPLESLAVLVSVSLLRGDLLDFLCLSLARFVFSLCLSCFFFPDNCSRSFLPDDEDRALALFLCLWLDFRLFLDDLASSESLVLPLDLDLSPRLLFRDLPLDLSPESASISLRSSVSIRRCALFGVIKPHPPFDC